MQPRQYRRLAAVLIGSAEGRQHGVLEGVGGLLRVTHRAQRHRPQPVPVAQHQARKRLIVAANMGLQQSPVGRLGRNRAMLIQRHGITCTSAIAP